MLKLDEVSLRLGGKTVLDGLSLTLRPGRVTALVGRNGSGKSTLLACVNQQLPYEGQILFENTNLTACAPRQRAQKIAVLPQTLPAPHITVAEMAAFGRNPYVDFTGRLTQQDREKVGSALRDARAEELKDRFVDTLSGGERQRAALAMILAQDTPLMLLDEPSAHMDGAQEAAFLRLLRQLTDEKGKTFLVVLHELNAAVRYADDLWVLESGKMVFAGTKEECLATTLLEDTFGLRRYTLQEDGRPHIFFEAE